jgi:hypothetical protein
MSEHAKEGLFQVAPATADGTAHHLKTWSTPKVIVSTVDHNTESSGSAGADGHAHGS